MYYDIGAHDMKYDEFKEMCRKAWSEEYKYLCIDMAKNKNESKYFILSESKNTYIECICKTQALKLFKSLKCCFQLKTEKIWKN